MEVQSSKRSTFRWYLGILSIKKHLQRVAGPKNLTYEEFSTLLVLHLSGDIEDLDALTPAHLVIGRSLVSIPEPSKADVSIDPLTYWDLVKCLRDRFWSGYSREYLNTL